MNMQWIIKFQKHIQTTRNVKIQTSQIKLGYSNFVKKIFWLLTPHTKIHNCNLIFGLRVTADHGNYLLLLIWFVHPSHVVFWTSVYISTSTTYHNNYHYYQQSSSFFNTEMKVKLYICNKIIRSHSILPNPYIFI